MVLRGKLPMEVHELQEKYGEILRISPDQVTIINSEAWKEVYGLRPGHPQRPKDQRHVVVGPNSTPSILRTDDHNHARYRRSLAHGFSEGSLQKQEPGVEGYIDMLVQRLREQITKGNGSTMAGMIRWYNFTTFDIIGDLAFGESFGCLDTSDYHFWVSVIFSHFGTAAWANVLRRIPGGHWLMRYIVPPKVRSEKRAQDQLTEAKVSYVHLHSRHLLGEILPHPGSISHRYSHLHPQSYAENRTEQADTCAGPSFKTASVYFSWLKAGQVICSSDENEPRISAFNLSKTPGTVRI